MVSKTGAGKVSQVRESRESSSRQAPQHAEPAHVSRRAAGTLVGAASSSAGVPHATFRSGDDALSSRAGRVLAQRIVRPAPVNPPVSPADVGERFLAALRTELGDERFDRYARGRLDLVFSAAGLRVHTTSRALADLFKRRFMTEIHNAAQRALGRSVAITIEADDALAPTPLAPMPSSFSNSPSELPAFDLSDTTVPQEHPSLTQQTSQAAASASRQRLSVPLPANNRNWDSAHPSALTGNSTRHSKSTLIDRYRLEDFIVGPSNRLAYNAALQIADGLAGPGEIEASLAYSMLFVHGPCGVGKSHILHGIAQRFRERAPGSVVRITSGEAFVSEFVTALRSAGSTPGSSAAANAGGPERFRKNYRRVDLLVIDDVQALANKTATQVELLHTFEEIMGSGARIVLASDQHPRQLEKFSPQLISRFLAGMVAGISPPDEELTRKLVKTFAIRRGLVLDDAGVSAVASRARLMPGASSGVSVREIEGIVTRLEAVHKLLPDSSGASRSGAINLLTIERALGTGQFGYADPAADPASARASQRFNTFTSSGSFSPSGRPIRMEVIIAHTCRYLGVDPGDLSGRTRHKRVVLARAVITHLARQFTTMSYPEIARAIGRPNHSTVITAYQRLAEQIAANETLGVEYVPEPMSIKALLERLAAAVSGTA